MLLALIVAGAVCVVIYAFVSKAPAGRARLHLPDLGNLPAMITGPGSCSSKIYPAGAEYTYESCFKSTTPVRWKPCSTVTYSVDPSEAPAGYHTDLAQAIGDLTAATRLHLAEVTGSGDINIAWDPSLFNPQPGTSGEAGVTDLKTTTDLSGAKISGATVRISSHLAVGPANGNGEEPVLLHELGHAVGLGHFVGPVIMNPTVGSFTSYQPGDLAGLAALYHPSSC